MPGFTLNGLPLTDLVAQFPRTGVWVVDVLTADLGVTPIVAGQPVSLVLGTLSLTGTVVQGGQLRGSEYLRVIGGQGRIGTTVPAQSFVKPTLYQVATAIIAATGEAISPTVTPASLPGLFAPIDHWMQRTEAGSKALSRIADAVGAVWRVLPDGTIWIGIDAYLPATLTNASFMNANKEQRQATWGITQPELLPGTTLSAVQGATTLMTGPVGFVEYDIKPSKYRMKVLYGDSPYTPTVQPFADMVDNLTADKDYLGEYPCTIVLQQPDGTFDLLPDDITLAGTQSVAAKAPDVQQWATAPGPPPVSLLTGSKVVLAFENGDPSKPYIRGLWAGAINVTCAGPVITLTYLPPQGGTPQVTVITLANATAALTSGGTFQLTAIG